MQKENTINSAGPAMQGQKTIADYLSTFGQFEAIQGKDLINAPVKSAWFCADKESGGMYLWCAGEAIMGFERVFSSPPIYLIIDSDDHDKWMRARTRGEDVKGSCPQKKLRLVQAA